MSSQFVPTVRRSCVAPRERTQPFVTGYAPGTLGRSRHRIPLAGVPTRATRGAAFLLLALLSTSVSAQTQSVANTAAAQPSPSATKDVTPSITWSFDASQTTVPARSGDLFLRVRIDTSDVTAKVRQPLNLVLVLDRSNSMNIDSKLGFLKKAGHLVANNLTAQDYVALVAYHHEVQTIVPMHPVVNREYLHHRIDEIEADGYTNISAGFLEGVAQMELRAGEPGLHHLILLTDGVANEGVTDPNQLVEMVRQAHERNMTISTIGVGVEYDESLLTRMAQAGGGRYSFVAQPDQIPNVVQNELGSMLAVAAQNAKLTLNVPQGLKVEQIYGHEESITQGKVEIPLGDLTMGVDRCLLIRVRTDSSFVASGETVPITATLTYDDMTTHRREQSQQNVALDGHPAAPATLTDVLAYARLVEAVDRIMLAVKGMDRTMAGQVLQFRRQDFPLLKQTALASGDQEFVNKAFLFEHFSGELNELVEEGALHEHSEARAELQKDLQYRRYMMEHHAHSHAHGH